MKDTTAQWMQDNLLDFDICKTKMIHPATGEETKFFGLFNQSYDGRHSNDVFRIVTEEYRVYDNNSLALLTEAIAEQVKTPIENCQVRTNNQFSIIAVDVPFGSYEVKTKKKGDIVKKYVRISEDRTGATGLNIGLYNVVLSCTNGATTTDKQTRYNLSHSSLLEQQIKYFTENLPRFLEGQEIYEEKCHRMAKEQVNDLIIRRVVEMSARLEVKNAISESTRTIDKIMVAVESEMEEKGFTKYGLFNGITKYFTHEYGNPNNRLKGSLPNGIIERKQRAVFEFLN